MRNKRQNSNVINTLFSHIMVVPYRFSLAFECKVAEVDAAQARLSTFTQRLTFAKRRVETIQGAVIRDWRGRGLSQQIIQYSLNCMFFQERKNVALFLFFRFDHEEGGSAESSAGQQTDRRSC